MGIYDSQIASLRSKIRRLNGQINDCKKDIRELEAMLEKCDTISSKVDETMNSILGNIDKKGAALEGNFVLYYKNQINQIARNNKLYDVSSNVMSDKNLIKSKLIAQEDEIQSLQRTISSLERDIAYYQSINVEAESQVN